MSILDQLHQNEIWIDNEYNTWRLENMTPKHRRNLLNWLRNNHEALKFTAELQMVTGYRPTSDAAADCFDAAFDELLRTSSWAWLHSLPLVERLKELVRQDAV